MTSEKTSSKDGYMGASRDGVKPQYAVMAGMASIAVAVILIVVKAVTFWASGSVSVLASLMDSISDSAVSLINFAAISYSARPADHDHRYGHGKIEGLAALFQGAFIFGAGVFLVLQSLSRFYAQEPLQAQGAAIGVMVFAIVLSIVLVAIQNHSLKHAPSLAVEAEKAHYSMDILLNGGVIGVLALTFYGAPQWIDPVFAICVAGYMGYTAQDIGRKGLDMLLDRELPDEEREKIMDLVRNDPDVLSFHDLRTRKAGMQLYITVDIEVDPDWSLKKAHGVSLRVERAIMKIYPNAEILIHVDPAGIPHEESRHNVQGIHVEEGGGHG